MADDRVDALFTLRPEDFTAARNDLARQLRAAGERERARQVAGLRRPTVAAWAVNQAVRTDPDAYAALLDAGREVRRAQRRALSGMAKAGLREAGRARREHIDRLAGKAADVLAGAGGDPAPHQEDIVATFDAASANDEAGEAVAAARLSRPLPAPSAFDDLAALSLVEPEPEPAASGSASPVATADSDERRRAADAVSVARRRADEAASARRRAREDADAAGRLAHEQAAEAEKAVAEAERARREADRLRARAEAARDDARRRSDEADDADRVAQERARDLEQAEERLRALPDRPTRGRA